MTIRNIIRIGIGSVFIMAAILKLIAIDEFEIYVYSFNVLNFLATSIFARLLVAGEFMLGLFMIFKMHWRFTWNTMMVVQILFTAFLTYTAIFRNDANCHCFGDLVELSPLESIAKNIVIIVLLFLLAKDRQPAFRHRSWHTSLIVGGTLLIVFVVTPPDVVYKMIYSTEKEISTVDLYDSFDDVVGFNSQQPTADSLRTVAGGKLIVIVSSGCKYCQLGIKKLSMVMKKKGQDTDKINIFIWGSDEGIFDFIKETGTEDYSYWRINPKQAIDITYGRFPIFIWMEDGEVVDVGDFRDIDEKQLTIISDF